MDNSTKTSDDVLREFDEIDALNTKYVENAKARGIDTNAPVSSYEKMYDMYVSGFRDLSYFIYGKDEVEECIPLYEKIRTT